MKSLKIFVNEKEYRRTGGTPENAPFHSKNYRQYFEGYSEYEEKDASGKKRIRRVYTGVLHCADLSPSLYTKIRFLYVLLFLSGIVCFFYAATRPLSCNSAAVTVAFEAMTVLCYGRLAWFLFNYLTNKKEMTLMEFHYTKAVCSASLHTVIPLSGVILSSCFCQLSEHAALTGSFAFYLLALLFSAMFCLLIHKIESGIPYNSYLSKEQAPEHACYLSK